VTPNPRATVPTRATAETLRIGGVERLSLVDWPGQLAAVVFCQGCGWQCGYCHNPHLIPFAPRNADDVIAWKEFVTWLERRRGLLDAVVFSGGEPTLQPGLRAAIEACRAMGFRIGLHTGGPVPGNLALVLPLVEWVGFDFKAPFDRYARVTRHDHGERARESFRLLRDAGVATEVRTTWHPQLLDPDDLVTMAQTLAAAGVAEWIVQRFRTDGCLDESLCAAPFGDVPLPACVAVASGLRITVR
jgi:pyruvate formate lyase activating enzyme